MSVIRISAKAIADIIFGRRSDCGFLGMIYTTVLHCPMDESADEKMREVLVVTAVIGRTENWQLFEDAWYAALGSEIIYFHSKEFTALDGEFRKFRNKEKYPPPAGRQAAQRIVSQLEDVLLSQNFGRMAIGISMADYADAVGSEPEAKMLFSNSSYTEIYSALMVDVARQVQSDAPECAVAYVYDDSPEPSINFERVYDAFQAARLNHPEVGERMRSLVPLSDKVHAPLQAADLLAHVMKDAFLAWFRTDRSMPIPLDKKWSDGVIVKHPKREWLMGQIKRNLENPKYLSCELPIRADARKVMERILERARRRTLKKAYRDSQSKNCESQTTERGLGSRNPNKAA
jgi:hypothetical protein